MTHLNKILPRCYAVFHCNLAFSSIAEERHSDVIEKCYWPLLRIIEEDKIPLGIEMTGYTLKRINQLCPDWIHKFKNLLHQNKCEYIASGEHQIIGPLIPYDVNVKNLQLGNLTVAALLGIKPTIAYVNEQALSAGILDLYLDCGFKNVFVEWDNLYSHSEQWSIDSLFTPQTLRTSKGREIKVLWNWSIAFQKLQRVCHDQLSEEDYRSFVLRSLNSGIKAFPIYGNDGEVFDFRPGRFIEEKQINRGEWDTLRNQFNWIKSAMHWSLPNEILKAQKDTNPLNGFTPSHPISVKKQQKYNLTRWALTGRNDLLINTYCYNLYSNMNNPDDTDWLQLCELWASDLRTHLVFDRYQKIEKQLAEFHQKMTSDGGIQSQLLDCKVIEVNEKNDKIAIQHANIHLQLDTRRGGAICSLSFKDQPPLLGTIEHGDNNHIAFAADFYSNHLVAELITQRRRVTDLNKSNFRAFRRAHETIVVFNCKYGDQDFLKYYRLTDDNKLYCGYEFSSFERPIGTLRLGYLTLLEPSPTLFYACHNGGDHLEKYWLKGDIDQGKAVSPLISSHGGLGASEGIVVMGNESQQVAISWDKAKCAAQPFIQRVNYNTEQLNRLYFSLVEVDETLKEGGSLLNFEFCLEQYHG